MGGKRRLQAPAGLADPRGCQQRRGRSRDATQRALVTPIGGVDKAAAPAAAPPRRWRLPSGAGAGREGVWAADGARALPPARPQLRRASARGDGCYVARRGLLRGSQAGQGLVPHTLARPQHSRGSTRLYVRSTTGERAQPGSLMDGAVRTTAGSATPRERPPTREAIARACAHACCTAVRGRCTARKRARCGRGARAGHGRGGGARPATAAQEGTRAGAGRAARGGARRKGGGGARLEQGLAEGVEGVRAGERQGQQRALNCALQTHVRKALRPADHARRYLARARERACSRRRQHPARSVPVLQGRSPPPPLRRAKVAGCVRAVSCVRAH
jgi:hypothetical protein